MATMLAYSWEIAFNARLYNILPFPAIKTPISLFDTGEPSYKIIFRNTQNNITNQIILNNMVEFVQTTTEFSPLCVMNPIRSILFTTTHLPVQPQLSQPPLIYSDNAPNGSINNNPDITNILTDFEVSVTPSNNYNGEITYMPSSEYRWIDLNPAYTLNRIDLKVYWKDKYGNNNQVFLPPGSSASVKLLFRSKKFYLGISY